MKKCISVIGVLVLLITCVNASAKTKAVSIKGIPIYSSSMKVYIDDMPISSYIIRNETYIFVSDLKKYGFELKKSGYLEKDLEINATSKPKLPPAISKLKGENKKIGNGIEVENSCVYVNSYPLSGKVYSLNGQILIPFCKMKDAGRTVDAKNQNSKIGYSKNGFRLSYDIKNHILRMDCLRSGNFVKTSYGMFPILNCNFSYIRYDLFKDVPALILNSDDSDTKCEYCLVNISQLLTHYSIPFSWENGSIAVHHFSEKIYLKTKPKFGSSSDSHLPIIEVPIHIEKNGKTISGKFRAMVCNGEIYAYLDDLVPYLFSTCDVGLHTLLA